jgi:hypothetical protein
MQAGMYEIAMNLIVHYKASASVVFLCLFIMVLIADAASEPEASEQVSSSNSYWGLKKVRFYFRFFYQNALLLTDQNALLLTDQNALHA